MKSNNKTLRKIVDEPDSPERTAFVSYLQKLSIPELAVLHWSMMNKTLGNLAREEAERRVFLAGEPSVELLEYIQHF